MPRSYEPQAVDPHRMQTDAPYREREFARSGLNLLHAVAYRTAKDNLHLTILQVENLCEGAVEGCTENFHVSLDDAWQAVEDGYQEAHHGKEQSHD